MHLLLTGATGLVGSTVLQAMLGTKGINQISIISRRPVPMVKEFADDRVKVIIHNDFGQYDDSLLDQIKGANGCVWALGASQNDVTKEEFIQITKTFTLKAAEAFENLAPEGEKFRFVFVSSEGATQNPGYTTALFGRVKGETEAALTAMHQRENARLEPIIVRPAYVDPSSHDDIKQWIPQRKGLLRFGDVTLGPVLRNLLPVYTSPSRPLGEFLTQAATGQLDAQLNGPGITVEGGPKTVSNSGFRRLMRLG